MPKTYRLQCAFAKDTTLPRDRMVINPCFHIDGLLYDADQLCEDLATALAAWAVGSGEITVRAYDVAGAKPNYPEGNAIRNTGTAPVSTVLREAALCLSFYADQNTPRRRGRLYVPVGLTGATPTGGTFGLRPSSGIRQKVADLVPIFSALGGQNVDWVVYSRVNHDHYKVSNWWVDDEWDIQRRRGLRPTTRDVGTTSGQQLVVDELGDLPALLLVLGPGAVAALVTALVVWLRRRGRRD